MKIIAAIALTTGLVLYAHGVLARFYINKEDRK